MVLCACVDDNNGMLFNHRRQSSDRVVVEKIIGISEGKRLWMDPYSAFLFPDTASICKDNDFLLKASKGDICFVEIHDISQCIDRAEKVYLFQWNRRYPADLYFPISAIEHGWKLIETSDFVGHSHKQITMKVYAR